MGQEGWGEGGCNLDSKPVVGPSPVAFGDNIISLFSVGVELGRLDERERMGTYVRSTHKQERVCALV